MSTFVSAEVREGLEKARLSALKKRSRLRVKVGEDHVRILKLWDTGFTVDLDDTSGLRGLVDIFDGKHHLYQALIVASQEEGGVMRYDFKRATRPEEHPATDYVRRAPRIAGVLT